MQEINGYVFIADYKRFFPLFGRRVNNTEGDYENFEFNNLTPFNTIKDLEISMKDFISRRNHFGIYPRKIDMILSENKDEFDFFKDKSGLVILSLEDNMKRLIGPWTKRTIPVTADNIASSLFNNGYKTFNENIHLHSTSLKTPYEKAIYALGDTERQRHTKCLLAQMDLKYL